MNVTSQRNMKERQLNLLVITGNPSVVHVFSPMALNKPTTEFVADHHRNHSAVTGAQLF